MRHVLKTWPCFFEQSWQGQKPFELRADDRLPRFAVGDTVILQEWDPEEGERPRYIAARISSVTRDRPQFGLRAGFAVLGLADLTYRDESWSDGSCWHSPGEYSLAVPRLTAAGSREIPYQGELYWALAEQLTRLADAIRDQIEGESWQDGPSSAVYHALADSSGLLCQVIQTPAERLAETRAVLATTGTEADRG